MSDTMRGRSPAHHEHDTSSTAVLFVNYFSEGLIERRLCDLTGRGFRLVVVDNSGTYGDPAHGERVVRTPENIGFGAACNAGVAALPPQVDTVVLHNPDVTAGAALLSGLVTELHRQPSPGLLAPAERQGTLLRRAGYRYPSVGRELAKVAHLRVHGPSSAAPLAPVRVEASSRGRRFGSGALLVVSRSAFGCIGGFDERYFLYGEDLDLWHRMAAVADVGFSQRVFDHDGGAGSRAPAATRELLRWLGVELFAELHGRPGHWRAYRAVHTFGLGSLRCDLAGAIATAWAHGATPSGVQRLLRRSLVH